MESERERSEIGLAFDAAVNNESVCSELVAIDYEELLRFANDTKNNSSNRTIITCDEILLCHQRLNLLLLDQIETAFGSNGLGIVAVRNIPNLNVQRQTLLPLAAKLPYIKDIDSMVDATSLYSTGWSHGKEILKQGQPDYSKGSFYANPLTDNLVESSIKRKNRNKKNAINNVDNDNNTINCNDDIWSKYYIDQAKEHPEFYAPNVWPNETLPELKGAFCTLGQTLVHVGRLIAKVCDTYCYHRHNCTTLELEKTITDSLNCNGRLLHYFAPTRGIQKVETNCNNNTNRNNCTVTGKQSETVPVDDQQLWCAWHNDHGSLTGLVPGMYLDEFGQEVPCPDNRSGLYILPRQPNGEFRQQQQLPIRICLPEDCINCALFQIGETSQLQSGGILQATPHAVVMTSPPSSSSASVQSPLNNITRQSFAVFMEPEFDTVLRWPNKDNEVTHSKKIIQLGHPSDTTTVSSASTSFKTYSTIHLPSLQERYKPGYTFGQFHLATFSAFTTKE